MGSNGLARGTVDAEQHFGALQVRLVAAQQSGDKTGEGLTDSHNTVLLSSRLATSPSSALRLDLESQTTHLPFPFGTVYAGNQFWYDKPYVSAAESTGARRNDRVAAYWDQSLGDNTTLRTHAQHATGQRNDDLLGFWTVTSPTTINSYARHIDENYDQTDWGLSVERTLTLGDHTHHARLAYTDSLQTLDFSGPQSIGLFSINLADPQFTTPLASISLTPRVQNERYSERTLSASDRIELSPRWQLQAALTRNTIQIDSSASSAPMAPAAAHTLTNAALTVSHQLAESLRMWLGWSNAFEPNRGMVKSGDFLPPKQAQQLEMGTEFKQGNQSLQVTLFDVQQTNLAAVDPTDRNYLIPFGAARSSGLQFTARHAVETVTWYAGATLQSARVTTPTSAAQGVYLPGMADRYGAVGATWQPRTPHWPAVDLKMIAVGERPGDSNGSFFAPGAAVWNLNIFGKAPAARSAQWALSVQNLLDTRYVRALSTADFVWQGERRKVTLAWTQQL
jgi:outer membrane receptor protein involved in Fe transport